MAWKFAKFELIKGSMYWLEGRWEAPVSRPVIRYFYVKALK